MEQFTHFWWFWCLFMDDQVQDLSCIKEFRFNLIWDIFFSSFQNHSQHFSKDPRCIPYINSQKNQKNPEIHKNFLDTSSPNLLHISRNHLLQNPITSNKIQRRKIVRIFDKIVLKNLNVKMYGKKFSYEFNTLQISFLQSVPKNSGFFLNMDG